MEDRFVDKIGRLAVAGFRDDVPNVVDPINVVLRLALGRIDFNLSISHEERNHEGARGSIGNRILVVNPAVNWLGSVVGIDLQNIIVVDAAIGLRRNSDLDLDRVHHLDRHHRLAALHVPAGNHMNLGDLSLERRIKLGVG